MEDIEQPQTGQPQTEQPLRTLTDVVKAWWAPLSPTARKIVLGGVGAFLFLMIVIVFTRSSAAESDYVSQVRDNIYTTSALNVWSDDDLISQGYLMCNHDAQYGSSGTETSFWWAHGPVSFNDASAVHDAARDNLC